MSHEEMKRIAEERYGIFETNRRLGEAVEADAEDLRELKIWRKH